MIEKLSEANYSRRAQAITWNPKEDPPTYDPPCLQRLWCRVLADESGGLVLNMNTHWRSRDAYKAAYMNIFALTDLHRVIAERLSEKVGKSVRVGRYVDIVDSFHIYGSYFEEFKGFLKSVEERTFEQRTWNSEFAEPMFEDGRKRLEEEKKKEGRG
jgi:thymidylate synthase